LTLVASVRLFLLVVLADQPLISPCIGKLGLTTMYSFDNDKRTDTFVIVGSVDTVKTRLQGQPPYRAPKYFNMVQSYRTILKEEGIVRGLYAGVTPAMLGSGKGKLKSLFLP
jgi:hypothetical protein